MSKNQTESGNNDDLDSLDIDIEDLIDEEMAEGFIRSYKQRGGQGWTGWLDVDQIFNWVAMAVANGLTYDTMKALLRSVFRRITEVSSIHPGVAVDDPEFDHQLHEMWVRAKNVLSPEGELSHSPQEANTFHTVLFLLELMRANQLVKLESRHYEILSSGGLARPERLSPSQLVALIVEGWLQQNPQAEQGVW